MSIIIIAQGVCICIYLYAQKIKRMKKTNYLLIAIFR